MKVVASRQFDWSGEALSMSERREAAELSAKPDGAVRLGHLSDFHHGKPPKHDESVPAVVETWLRDYAEAGVDAVVVSGDLVDLPGDRVAMLRMRYLLEQSGMPWVTVPGNHDVARPKLEGPFYELFGDYPRVERHAGVDFVLLDSLGGYPFEERTPFERLDYQGSGVPTRGKVGEEQLRRATGLLPEGSGCPRVLVIHHHLWPQDDILDDPPPTGAIPALMIPCLDADRLWDWAGKHGIRLAFHGHRHAHWPPYIARGRAIGINSGSSTRGKPVRRGRVVDIVPGEGPRTVWEVAYEQ